MKIKPTLSIILILLVLAACGGKPSASPLSPQEQAYAQTQFVQQAATSAAAYARTAQPNALLTDSGLPTAPNSATGTAKTENPPTGLTPSQPLPTGSLPTNAAGTGLPPTQGSGQPTSPNPTAIISPSKTPTRTATTVPTPTPTPTATPQSGWEGTWVIYFQQTNGSYLNGQMTVTINGTDLSAEGAINGVPFTFTGRVLNDGLIASGTWSSTQSSGSFTWTLVQTNQFGGDRDLSYGMCGARAGAQPPEPCYIPPLS